MFNEPRTYVVLATFHYEPLATVSQLILFVDFRKSLVAKNACPNPGRRGHVAIYRVPLKVGSSYSR